MITGIVTLILLATFVGGAAWVYSAKRRTEFDAAARIPLEEISENTP